jgi:acyl-CoA synthetase (AMP-forming)/AMP-acid ligase II
MTQPSNLAELVSGADPAHAAVIIPEDGTSISYRGLADQVESLAAALRASDLRPGDAVALVLPNGLEFLAAFLAVVWARLVAAPLNPAYKPEEFRFYLEDAGVRAVIAPAPPHSAWDVARQLEIPLWQAARNSDGVVRLDGPGLKPSAGAVPEPPRPDDVALFLHTSGTTSRPKGVPLRHSNLVASASNIASHYGLTPEDTSLVVMPLFHVHGLIGATLSTFRSGGTVVVPARFSASAFWPAARAHRATWYSAVPTIHQVLLGRADADDAPLNSGLRFIRSCSSALAPAMLGRLEGRFNAPVLEAYGMTEAAHQMTSNPLPPAPHKPGTVGRGAQVEVAVMDEAGQLVPSSTPGEVLIRGPNVMHGYHNNPAANEAAFTAGWFRTGDRGVLDGDGYLSLIGRIKELINRGGEKISPLEIDAVLLAHPAVAEAATFGAPDAKYGEEVQAAVVLKGSATDADLQAHCRRFLADFKVPKVFYIVPQLPHTATGKVQRRNVAAAFLESDREKRGLFP